MGLPVEVLVVPVGAFCGEEGGRDLNATMEGPDDEQEKEEDTKLSGLSETISARKKIDSFCGGMEATHLAFMFFFDNEATVCRCEERTWRPAAKRMNEHAS